jgi:hypothetical protein
MAQAMRVEAIDAPTTETCALLALRADALERSTFFFILGSGLVNLDGIVFFTSFV